MEPNEIIPGLFIGNMHSAKDANFFKNKNIGAVLNCTPDVPHYFAHESGFVEYMRLTVNDSLKEVDFQKMSRYLPDGIAFIHKNLDIDKNNILVHCHAGIQRSAAMVVGYLMATKNMTLPDALKLVRRQRPITFSNGRSVNFKSSLIDLSQKLQNAR